MVDLGQLSFKLQLERWHTLYKRRQALERRIQEAEILRERMNYKLTPDGIRGSLTQQYATMDMPRPPGVSDKTGNLVANAYDGVERTEDKLWQWQREYIRLSDECAEIEDWIAILSERYQRVVVAFYRDHVHWAEICRVMCMERANLYKMLDRAVQQIDDEKRMFER